jgi:hypothetical protein
MTAQIPEKIINRHDGVDFGDYELVSIFVGNPTDINSRKDYPFKEKGNVDKVTVCSACWRGYISVYELTSSGELVLIAFEYPFGNAPMDTDPVNEVLEGDFWLELRTEFFGDAMFIPFENGKIVSDRSRWLEDKCI